MILPENEKNVSDVAFLQKNTVITWNDSKSKLRQIPRQYYRKTCPPENSTLELSEARSAYPHVYPQTTPPPLSLCNAYSRQVLTPHNLKNL